MLFISPSTQNLFLDYFSFSIIPAKIISKEEQITITREDKSTYIMKKGCNIRL